MKPSCASRSLVDRHFAGTISPADERALRGHLETCATCRERYDRYLLLARLDRSVPSAEDRLARGLGLSRPRRAWRPLAVVALGFAVALLVFQLRSPDPQAYVARGGAAVDPDQALYVYRIAAGGVPQPVLDGVIRTGDELAFAYRNRAGWPRVLVYGVDQGGRVYWYHPGWTDPAATPVAVPIEAGPERHELPEAVAQPLPPGRLQIHAVFTDEAVDVRAIERGAVPARATEIVVSLDVLHDP